MAKNKAPKKKLTKAERREKYTKLLAIEETKQPVVNTIPTRSVYTVDEKVM